jgi:hypothetical protein
MKFHEFRTMQMNHPQEHVRRMRHEEYFAGMVNTHDAIRDSKSPMMLNDFGVLNALVAERKWIENRRPYYHAYPAVCSALQNTKLTFTLSELGVHLQPTAICFVVGHEPTADGMKVESVAFSLLDRMQIDVQGKHLDIDNKRLVFRMRLNVIGGKNAGSDRILQCSDETPIAEWALGSHLHIAALCIGLAMLANDDRFAEPMLLNRDYGKPLTPEQKQAAIERAKRNGKNVIEIGKHIDASPHFRRPHFGIRWTSKGRSIPKLVPIKGCLVSRSKLYPIPTGYLDDDEKDSQP